MRKFFQFLNGAFGILANTLQVSGLTFPALMALMVSTLVGLIGKLRNMDPFWIACSVPVVFVLTAVGFAIIRTPARRAPAQRRRTFREMAEILYPKAPWWRRLLKVLQRNPRPQAQSLAPVEAPPLRWLRPGVAVDVLAAPELVQAREQRLARLRELDQQVRAQRARQNAEVLRQAGIGHGLPEEPLPLDPVIERAFAAAGLVNREEQEARYTQANMEVMTDIHAKLARGELRARGFLPPVLPNSQEVDIPAVQWRFLQLNVTQETASGHAVTYVAVALAQAEGR